MRGRPEASLRHHLAGELSRQFDGYPWHGSSLAEILKGVTARQAPRRVGSGHTMFELVAHLTAWNRQVSQRLRNHEATEPAEGDWPPVSRHSEAAWRAATSRLRRSHAELMRLVRGIPTQRLHRPVRDFRNSPDGIGASIAETVSGVLQHSVYHAGQIALLKRQVLASG